MPSDKDEKVNERIQIMSEDAKSLQQLLKRREGLVKDIEDKLSAENKERNASLSKIRNINSSLRTSKNEKKEQERQKLTRTLMANLCTAADYPDAPPYVPHMINVLKNILGNNLLKLYNS